MENILSVKGIKKSLYRLFTRIFPYSQICQLWRIWRLTRFLQIMKNL